jgi:hypothetical protein
MGRYGPPMSQRACATTGSMPVAELPVTSPLTGNEAAWSAAADCALQPGENIETWRRLWELYGRPGTLREFAAAAIAESEAEESSEAWIMRRARERASAHGVGAA